VSALSDEIIMSSVRKGQLSDLTELFNRYHLAMFNFFLKLTADKAKSEDLTQNLFYRIIRYRESFDLEKGSFKSWIYQMARNIHLDYCKQEKRSAEIVKDANYIPEKEVAVTEYGYRESDFQQLQFALNKLGPVDRELILLSRFEGLKYQEISKMKNMSEGSIKVQIHRAMKELKRIYFKQKGRE
jgi:RNA polymerase sigma-70 factor, ECF subfamily